MPRVPQPSSTVPVPVHQSRHRKSPRCPTVLRSRRQPSSAIKVPQMPNRPAVTELVGSGLNRVPAVNSPRCPAVTQQRSVDGPSLSKVGPFRTVSDRFDWFRSLDSLDFGPFRPISDRFARLRRTSTQLRQTSTQLRRTSTDFDGRLSSVLDSFDRSRAPSLTVPVPSRLRTYGPVISPRCP